MRGFGTTTSTPADHVTSTQSTALAELGRSSDQTLHDWRQQTTSTLELCAMELPDVIQLHGLTLSPADFLVVRAFEMWTHEEDIRHAVGLPLVTPDDSTLALMTRLVAKMLPFGMAMTGHTTAARVRLVLTGTGGGILPSPWTATTHRGRERRTATSPRARRLSASSWTPSNSAGWWPTVATMTISRWSSRATAISRRRR